MIKRNVLIKNNLLGPGTATSAAVGGDNDSLKVVFDINTTTKAAFGRDKGSDLDIACFPLVPFLWVGTFL